MKILQEDCNKIIIHLLSLLIYILMVSQCSSSIECIWFGRHYCTCSIEVMTHADVPLNPNQIQIPVTMITIIHNMYSIMFLKEKSTQSHLTVKMKNRQYYNEWVKIFFWKVSYTTEKARCMCMVANWYWEVTVILSQKKHWRSNHSHDRHIPVSVVKDTL